MENYVINFKWFSLSLLFFAASSLYMLWFFIIECQSYTTGHTIISMITHGLMGKRQHLNTWWAYHLVRKLANIIYYACVIAMKFFSFFLLFFLFLKLNAHTAKNRKKKISKKERENKCMERIEWLEYVNENYGHQRTSIQQNAIVFFMEQISAFSGCGNELLVYPWWIPLIYVRFTWW